MREVDGRLRDALAKIAEVASDAVMAVDRYRPADGGPRGGSPKKGASRRSRNGSGRDDAFDLATAGESDLGTAAEKHVYGNGIVCDTEKRGHKEPDNRDPLRIRIDASDGFIPLWEQGTTLRWRFRERSMQVFRNPEAAKSAIEGLFAEAITAWGDASPVRFSKRDDAWDFEFVMVGADDCDASGCVLASAFFPGGGQQQVFLYPKMFEQSHEEQVETLIHEFGHVFGLRHFFANVSETAWPSELFGEDNRFSIMNYGADSVLTGADTRDLKHLYDGAWSGELTQINGTPIRFVRPFHAIGSSPVNASTTDRMRYR